MFGWFLFDYVHTVPVTEPGLVPEVGAGKTFVVGTNTVQWISDPEKVNEAFKLQELTEPTPEGKERTGLSVYTGRKCTIYAYEPSGAEDEVRMYVLGHEMLHCFRGDYHK